MKQFFKFMFASCLGSALMLVLVYFIIIGAVTSMISSSKDTVTVTPKSVLYMNLNYQIPERTNEDELTAALSGLNANFEQADMSGMNDILANIDAAATDPNIAGIFLELSEIGTSTANIEEIRNHLIKFRESGKFVISYAETMAQSAYYLATASDEIYINPQGSLDIHGMAAQVMFYKNMLDKLDIEMQIIRGPNNRFKSAVEPYFLDKMSDANREQYEKLLGSVWYKIVSDISETRGVNIKKINELADNLSLTFDAKAALEEKFVDGLLYRDQIIAIIKDKAGIDEKKDIEILQNSQYAEARVKPKSMPSKIAVIYASGQIFDGEGDNDKIGSVTLSKAIREAREDDKVKAIVMRVNSPGGSALASEVIRREVELAKSAKPFIISMGNYAASGGYWISCEGDRIFTDATTLTGSIGVFGTFPNAQKFLNDKIGLTFDGVKTNENADFGRISQPLTPYQKSMLQKYVGETYNDFTALVARTRGLRQSYVDSIGQGRVWSGVDALELGLVDEIGGIDKAIEYAAKQANLTDYSFKYYPEQQDLMQQLLNGNVQEPYTKSLLQKRLGKNYSYLQAMENVESLDGIQALMPFSVME
ncbi:MAG: signal peptide peptidase SppA [Bacteroidales bacterium]|nr:signal peptide peptidase SppA [Bacteroidales bacterium]